MGLLTGLLDAVNSSLKADAIDRVTNTGYYDGEHGNPPQWGIFGKMELINKEKAEMLKQYYTDAYKLGVPQQNLWVALGVGRSPSA